MGRQATAFIPKPRSVPSLRDFAGLTCLGMNAPAGDIGVLFFGPFPPGLSVDFLNVAISAVGVAAATLHVGTFVHPEARADFLTRTDRLLIGGEDTAAPSTGMPFQVVTTLGSQFGAFQLMLFHRIENSHPFLGVRITSAAEDIFGAFSVGVLI